MSMLPVIMATKGLIIDIRMGKNGMKKEILYKNRFCIRIWNSIWDDSISAEYRCFQEQYWNPFSVLVRT